LEKEKKILESLTKKKEERSRYSNSKKKNIVFHLIPEAIEKGLIIGHNSFSG